MQLAEPLGKYIVQARNRLSHIGMDKSRINYHINKRIKPIMIIITRIIDADMSRMGTLHVHLAHV